MVFKCEKVNKVLQIKCNGNPGVSSIHFLRQPWTETQSLFSKKASSIAERWECENMGLDVEWASSTPAILILCYTVILFVFLGNTTNT